MKKESFLIHVAANIVIVVLLVGLYIGCINTVDGNEVSAKPFYKGDTNKKSVSIMINVYQGSEYIPEILDCLAAFDAKATFFVGGSWVAKNNALLKEMAKNNEIGNHGYLHKSHDKLGRAENEEEIRLCHRLIKELTGRDMNLFAPPSGAYGDTTVEVCKELNYRVIMWSKDTIDWRDKDYTLVYKRATNGISNGDLILMHPTEHTAKALPDVLAFYRENGFSAVTVSENIDTLGKL